MVEIKGGSFHSYGWLEQKNKGPKVVDSYLSMP